MCSLTDLEKKRHSCQNGLALSNSVFYYYFTRSFWVRKPWSQRRRTPVLLNMARFSPVECQFFPNQTISRTTVRILTIQCTKCRYLHTNNKQCDGKKSYLLPKKKKKRFMSSHLCFNERFSLELHVNPLTHNRVCCCQMRLENGIFILLEQASKSWTDDGPIGM